MVHGIAKDSLNLDNLNIVYSSFTGYTFQVGFTRFQTSTLAIRLVFLMNRLQMLDIQHSLLNMGTSVLYRLTFIVGCHYSKLKEKLKIICCSRKPR